jgi:hypothetical protein
MITFCWLPPESVDAGKRTDRVRISNSCVTRWAKRMMASRTTCSPRANGARS